MEAVLRTKDLGRIYKIRGGKKKDPKELIALQNVNLEIKPGELFGLLGPNGAGKTTLIKILTTLLAPTSGEAYVAGYNVAQDPEMVRPRINMVSGGETSGYGLLTVRENLWMFSQFYGIPSAEANKRIKDLLEIVGLGDRINTKSSDLSTGLRQKMNIVRGFMTDPEVLFLDEPTLGLDVGASRDVRQFIRTWVDQNRQKTLLLTTHYMVEADELCDRVAIINEGKVLACDTPEHLKHELQKDAIFRIKVGQMNGTGIEVFEEVPGVKKVTTEAFDGHVQLEFILEEADVLSGIINRMTEHDIHMLNFEKRQPTLEDVFVNLTGKRLEEAEDVSE